MLAEKIAGYDVMMVRSAAAGMIEHIRAGRGPGFLECPTIRWKEHVGPNEDFDVGYRKVPPAEVWPAQDPVVMLSAQVPASERQRMEDDISAEIRAAIDYACFRRVDTPGRRAISAR